MNDHGRLDHLRRLLDRLERMPASAHRDWMLAEVRRRRVDVETGTAPAPMRALPQDELEAELEAELAAERSPRPVSVKTHRRKRSRNAHHGRLGRPAARMAPVAAHEREHQESFVDLLQQGGVMCLDDAPAATTDASRGWAGGLRG
jgi:hypothetical protein